MKGYRCDMCKEWKNGGIPFRLSIVDRHADSRDTNATEDFDICCDCKNKLSSELNSEKSG